MDWLDTLGRNVTDSINKACGKSGGRAVFVYGNIAVDEDCDRNNGGAITRRSLSKA